MRKIIIIFFISCSMFAWSYTINGDGTPVDYSKIAVTARYWGMGKAGAAMANDSGSMMLNPAGLAKARSPEVSSMGVNLLGEFNYTMLNAVFPQQRETFGLSLLYETAGEIFGSDSLDTYGHPVQGDTIENYSTLISFGYARSVVWDNLFVGGVIKNMKRKISYVEGNSNALDLGVLYQWTNKMSFGFVVKNAVQTPLTYSNGASYGEHINQDYILGFSWLALDDKLLLSLDQHSDVSFGRTHLGAEYWWAKMVAIRAGLAEKDVTLGIGFRYQFFQVDYAVRYQEQPLEPQSYISVTIGDATSFFLSRPQIELVDDDNAEEESAETQTKKEAAEKPTVVKTENAPAAPTAKPQGSKDNSIQIVDY